MIHSALLASLYWNPNRFIFTVPIIDRPIAWYGFFFVLGFIIGYFLIIRMLEKDLRNTQYLCERDVISWKKFLSDLQTPLELMGKEQKLLFLTMPKKLQEEIIQFNPEQTPSQQLKDAIFESINCAMSKYGCTVNRENIQTHFPKALYSLKELATALTDKLTWFVIGGTLIGARLGHVFFYDWPRYREHLADIPKIWEGGLASHGGAIGVLLAIWLYHRSIRNSYPEFTFLSIQDKIVIPTALVGFFIRVGNFFNQEILGVETDLPWGVVFGNPFDALGNFPRHPVQLYEGFAYLALFFILLQLWRIRGESLRQGFMTGLFFTLLFTARFIIEFLKIPQGMMVDESLLQTGQYLSLPFILAGLWLMFRSTSLKSYGKRHKVTRPSRP